MRRNSLQQLFPKWTLSCYWERRELTEISLKKKKSVATPGSSHSTNRVFVSSSASSCICFSTLRFPFIFFICNELVRLIDSLFELRSKSGRNYKATEGTEGGTDDRSVTVITVARFTLPVPVLVPTCSGLLAIRACLDTLKPGSMASLIITTFPSARTSPCNCFVDSVRLSLWRGSAPPAMSTHRPAGFSSV